MRTRQQKARDLLCCYMRFLSCSNSLPSAYAAVHIRISDRAWRCRPAADRSLATSRVTKEGHPHQCQGVACRRRPMERERVMLQAHVSRRNLGLRQDGGGLSLDRSDVVGPHQVDADNVLVSRVSFKSSAICDIWECFMRTVVFRAVSIAWPLSTLLLRSASATELDIAGQQQTGHSLTASPTTARASFEAQQAGRCCSCCRRRPMERERVMLQAHVSRRNLGRTYKLDTCMYAAYYLCCLRIHLNQILELQNKTPGSPSPAPLPRSAVGVRQDGGGLSLDRSDVVGPHQVDADNVLVSRVSFKSSAICDIWECFMCLELSQ